MASQGAFTKVTKWGAGMCIVLTKEMQEYLRWRPGDRIAARWAGDKVVMERVPFEKLALLRTGEAELR